MGTPDLPELKPPTDDPLLATLMQLALAAAYAVAKDEELRVPTLVVADADGDIGAFQLLTHETEPSDMARVLVYATNAIKAAVCFESWMVELPATPEMLAADADGRPIRPPPLEVRPSQHPDRFDTLTLLGEVKGEPQRYHSWRIDVDPESRARTFRLDRWEGDRGVNLPSRFNPLFVDMATVRRLVRANAELQRLRDAACARRN